MGTNTNKNFEEVALSFKQSFSKGVMMYSTSAVIHRRCEQMFTLQANAKQVKL